MSSVPHAVSDCCDDDDEGDGDGDGEDGGGMGIPRLSADPKYAYHIPTERAYATGA